jgi:hypothetical protein
MAALQRENTDRCKEVARRENVPLGAAADYLVSLGWDRYVNANSDRKNEHEK